MRHHRVRVYLGCVLIYIFPVISNGQLQMDCGHLPVVLTSSWSADLLTYVHCILGVAQIRFLSFYLLLLMGNGQSQVV